MEQLVSIVGNNMQLGLALRVHQLVENRNSLFEPQEYKVEAMFSGAVAINRLVALYSVPGHEPELWKDLNLGIPRSSQPLEVGLYVRVGLHTFDNTLGGSKIAKVSKALRESDFGNEISVKLLEQGEVFALDSGARSFWGSCRRLDSYIEPFRTPRQHARTNSIFPKQVVQCSWTLRCHPPKRTIPYAHRDTPDPNFCAGSTCPNLGRADQGEGPSGPPYL